MSSIRVNSSRDGGSGLILDGEKDGKKGVWVVREKNSSLLHGTLDLINKGKKCERVDKDIEFCTDRE